MFNYGTHGAMAGSFCLRDSSPAAFAIRFIGIA
jgi:hypothetical protein